MGRWYVANPIVGQPIEVGRLLVMPCTDGLWRVYDDKLPVGYRTVQGRSFRDSAAAVQFARGAQ